MGITEAVTCNLAKLIQVFLAFIINTKKPQLQDPNAYY